MMGLLILVILNLNLDKIQIQQFFVGKPSLIVSVVNFTNVARCSFVPGKEPFKRNLRRTVMRHSTTQYTLYLLLSSLLSFSSSIIDHHHHHHHDQVMRYVNLSTLLVYRLVSGKVLAYLCLFSLKYFQNTKDYIFNKKLFNWKKKHCDHDKLVAGKDEVPNDGFLGRGQASSSPRG